MIVKTTLPTLVGRVDNLDLDSLNIDSVKNIEFSKALDKYQNTPIFDMLSKMKLAISGTYKYYLVDVKLHHLNKGDVPCIPGWHIDGGPEVDAEYAIAVMGSSLTKFALSNVELDFNGHVRSLCNDLHQKLKSEKSLTVFSHGIYIYDNLTPHSASPASYNGPRLLLRVMGNNKIQPTKSENFKIQIYKELQ